MEEKRSIQNVLEEMEQAKQVMAVVVSGKADLCDPEIVEASRKLDVLLNEYYRLLAPSP